MITRLIGLLLLGLLLPVPAVPAAERTQVVMGTPGGAPGNGAAPAVDAVAAIRRYIAASLSTNESEIQVQPVDGLPVGIVVLTVKEAVPGALLGRTTFMLTMQRKGGSVASRWVTVDVSWTRSVWVARRGLKRYSVIAPEDVELRTMVLTQSASQYSGDGETVVGKRVMRAIEAGVPIRPDVLDQAPVIIRGASVTLLVELNGLRVTTMGQAKEDGYAGRSIAVMNLDSRKIVYGEVMDGATVRVPVH